MDGLTTTFLVMFAAGLVFTVASFVFGSIGGGDAGHGGDLGHGGGDLGHGGDVGHGGHAGDGGHGGAHAGGHGLGAILGAVFAPLLNITALAAFCCTFGGVGYMLRRSGRGAPTSLVVALVVGIVVWYALVWLVRKLERDTRYKTKTWVPGVIGTLLAPVGGERVGELMHRTEEGARSSCPARSADGGDIVAGTEVVIVEIKDGIALVSPAADLLDRKGE